jgi:tetratricopeptide (TPR) repeat protein
MPEKVVPPPRRSRGKRGKPRDRPVFPPCPEWPRDELAVADEGDWPFQLLLWQRARDVALWAGIAPEQHRALFCEVVPEWQRIAEATAAGIESVAEPLRVLSAMIRYPDLAQPEDVCAACMAISEWAASNHLPETALRFAEGAAKANPTNARAAAHAGQIAAQEAADERAEVWYERGIKIGRRTEDWEWYIRSNIRLGILRYEQGKFRAARRCYGRARSRALWAGLPAFVGKAHHDMMLIELAVGVFATADRHARSALQYYPLHYERLPHLAQDYAILLSTYGFDEEALRVLDLALPVIILPAERIAVLGTQAKAAAGAGNRSLYRGAAEDVRLLASVTELNAAGALALAGEGAVVLRDWHRAEELASLALDIATRRREREPRRRAELVLLSVAARAVPPLPSPRPDPARVAETTALFLARLGDLGAPTTDAGAHTRGRTELTKFSIAGR